MCGWFISWILFKGLFFLYDYLFWCVVVNVFLVVNLDYLGLGVFVFVGVWFLFGIVFGGVCCVGFVVSFVVVFYFIVLLLFCMWGSLFFVVFFFGFFWLGVIWYCVLWCLDFFWEFCDYLVICVM